MKHEGRRRKLVWCRSSRKDQGHTESMKRSRNETFSSASLRRRVCVSSDCAVALWTVGTGVGCCINECGVVSMLVPAVSPLVVVGNEGLQLHFVAVE